MNNRNILLRRITVLSIAAIAISLIVLIGGVLLWIWNSNNNNINIPQPRQYTMDMSVKTTEGIQEELLLNDNSKIRVNSNSILKYAADYKIDRNIQLTGEAYFKIKKMDRSFTLTADQVTLVMYGGTFLLESYPDKDYTRLCLFAGEAKLVINETSQEIILNPGTDLLLYKTTGELEMKRIKEGVYGPAWITNTYDYMALNNILYSLSEYYDISVTNNRPELNYESFTLTFEGDKTLKEVMSILQVISKKFSYRIDDNELIIF